jgi:hypothetical protein
MRITISQKLPAEYEEKLIHFQIFIISLRSKYGYLLSQTGNNDHTPIWLNMPN